jgi:glycerol kinase
VPILSTHLKYLALKIRPLKKYQICISRAGVTTLYSAWIGNSGKGMAERSDIRGNPQAHASTLPLFLSIDQGGHASRVLVFDPSGRVVVEARQTVAVRHPQPDWVEQDADALVESVQSALTQALEKLGGRRDHIVAAGLVTQRSNIVCWDRNTGHALSPVISWQDRRAYRWMQHFTPHTARIRHITGLLPSAHYGASKIHWCLTHLDGVATARAQGTLACGPLASFLLFRLLQERPVVVDSVNASRTLLWDSASRDWSDELLTLFSLNADYLPRCVPNRHDFGRLAVVDFSVPLTVCSGDQSAALFSQGMPNAGWAYLNMGTGAFMQCLWLENESRGNETQKKERRKKETQKNEPPQNESVLARLLQSVVWDEPGESLQVVEATVNGAGSALAVVEQALGISSEKAQSQYAHWLETVKNIPFYLNGIAGLGSPFWRPDFVSRFVADNIEMYSAEEKLVAVMESILFLVKVNLEELRDESVDVQRIVISGGLSALDGLCQRLADLSGLTVTRPSHREATAKGLAFLVARTFSRTSTQAEAKLLSKTTGTEWVDEPAMENRPDDFLPKENTALHERYQQWRNALADALADVLDSALDEGVGS